MPDIVISNISEDILERIKTRAARHQRTLEQEVVTILEDAVSSMDEEAAAVAQRIRERLSRRGGSFSDSADLLREDRVR